MRALVSVGTFTGEASWIATDPLVSVKFGGVGCVGNGFPVLTSTAVISLRDVSNCDVNPVFSATVTKGGGNDNCGEFTTRDTAAITPRVAVVRTAARALKLADRLSGMRVTTLASGCCLV